MLWQMIGCTLAAAGIILFAWCLVGSCLLPVAGSSLRTVYRVWGEAPDLEQTVRGFLWLRGTGMLQTPLEVVDCGLSESARARVEKLMADHACMQLTREESAPPERLAESG